jgi:hypothetical protein
MACDPDALRAKIELLEAMRSAEAEEAREERTEAGEHERYKEVRRLNGEIRAAEQELDICTTVPDADDPPFETTFAGRSWLVLEAFGDSFGIPGGPTLGFWFSASRRHVRIHEWPRNGGTLYWPGHGRGESFWLWTTGRMQRQMSGEVLDIQGVKHMRIPIILDVHAERFPFPASAALTLRTEPPPARHPFGGESWPGLPLHTDDAGRPAIRFVSEGTISSGFLVGARLVFKLDGTFTSRPIR